MAIENFTTWTETDPGTFLSQTSTTASFTALTGNGSTNHLNKDMGASWRTGNFTDRFEIAVSAESHDTNSRISLLIYGVTAFAEFSETFESLRVRWVAGGSTSVGTLTLDRFAAGAANQDTPTETATLGSTLNVGSTYYCELQRTGTATTLKVYSDSGYSTQVASTLTVTETSAMALRYATVTATWWAGAATTITGSVANLNLDYSAAAGTKYLRNKLFTLGLGA